MCGSFFVACAPVGATRLERGNFKMHKKTADGAMHGFPKKRMSGVDSE